MKFYIASSLKNYAQVRALSQRLQAAGWVHTYDWTQHCPEDVQDAEALRDIGERECAGVREANVVIVLSPQGRGTHTEFGMAIALEKRIFLCHSDDAYFRCDENTSAFYWLPQVQKLVGSTAEIADAILAQR